MISIKILFFIPICILLNSCNEKVIVNQPESVLMERTIPPDNSSAWIDNEYVWKENNYVLVPGHYAHHNGVWIPGHWAKSPKGYKWVKGYWK